MTGLWQVSGRSDLSWVESVRLDLWYVDNWSLSLDVQILLRTAGAVVADAGPTDGAPRWRPHDVRPRVGPGSIHQLALRAVHPAARWA